MSREGKFLVYCLEIYKAKKNLTGKEVSEIFESNHVYEYIISYFEALHTTGENYIILDIDSLINE